MNINTIKNKIVEKTSNAALSGACFWIAGVGKIQGPVLQKLAEVTGSESIDVLSQMSISDANGFLKVAKARDPSVTMAEMAVGYCTEVYPRYLAAMAEAMKVDAEKVLAVVRRLERAIEAFNKVEDAGGVLHDDGFIPDVNAMGMTTADEWLDDGQA